MNGEFGMLLPALLMLVMGSISLAWSIAVIVLLFKIWRKVKHLPG